MLNRYPLWKNLFITLIVAMGFYYAAPNLYAPDPALQIGGSSGAQGTMKVLWSVPARPCQRLVLGTLVRKFKRRARRDLFV